MTDFTITNITREKPTYDELVKANENLLGQFYEITNALICFPDTPIKEIVSKINDLQKIKIKYHKNNDRIN